MAEDLSNGYLKDYYKKYFLFIILSLLGALGISYFCAILNWSPINKIYLRFQLASPADGVVKLYYDEGKGWREEKCDRKNVKGGVGFITLLMTLNAKHVAGLRLDLPPTEKEISLRNFTQIDHRNVTLKSFSIHRLKQRKESVEIEYKQDVAIVKPLTSSPQLAIDIADLFVHRSEIRLNICLISFIFLFSLITLFNLWGVNTDPRNENIKNYLSYKVLQHFQRIVFFLGISLIPLSIYDWIIEAKPVMISKIKGSNRIAHYTDKIDGQIVTLKRVDGLNLAGTLYGSGNNISNHNKKAVLILHGNYKEGRMFPLYPIMANELTKKGYVVLSIDFAGYGGSEAPWSSEVSLDTSLEMETEAAIEYLSHLNGVNHIKQIGIIGHSMGAQPALWVGLNNKAVASIILIGPPRRIWERLNNVKDREYFWGRDLKNWKIGENNTPLPVWYNKEIWNEQKIWKDIVHTIPLLSTWNHNPLLLVDGENESNIDKEYLLWFYHRISYPKKYIELAMADHQCNVQIINKEIYYDPDIMNGLIEIIDEWYDDIDDVKNKSIRYIHNFIYWIFNLYQ